MSSYLITGASRGLGLALVDNLVSYPASKVGQIFATVRTDSAALNSIAEKSEGRVTIVKLDVTDEGDVKRVAGEVEAKLNGRGLDVLLNNAGVCTWVSNGVESMSTAMASITDAHKAATAPCPAYKISKAAANALTKPYALDLEKEGFVVFALSPGWLKTELGGGDMAHLTADQGAKASLDFVHKVSSEHNGTFPSALVPGMENSEPWPYDGKSSSW